MEVKGKVIQLLDEQTGESAKGTWVKRGFVIETNETYPKKIAIDIFNKPELIIPNIGTEATVSINIESKEHNGRFYTNINAWKIDGFSTGNAVNNSAPAPSDESDSGLPF